MDCVFKCIINFSPREVTRTRCFLQCEFDHEAVSQNSKALRNTSKRLLKELGKSAKSVQSMLTSTEKRGDKLNAKRPRLDFGGEGGGEERGPELDHQVEVDPLGGVDQQGEEELELDEGVVPGP